MGHNQIGKRNVVTNSSHDSWSESAINDLQRRGVSVLRDGESRRVAAGDWGRIVVGSPRAVVVPRTTDEVEQVMLFANDRGLPVTLRGIGHSQGGQSVAVDAITLDLSRLDRVFTVSESPAVASCEPGARVRAVAARSLEAGLVPRVMPNYVDLTIGGTLSVGGVGTSCHRYGPIIANVAELEVVAGNGRRIACSPQVEPELFHATLGGLGRCGVIVRASLRLRRLKPHLRTFYLLYDDIRQWVTDQRALVTGGQCDFLEGFCSASVQGTRKGPQGRRPFVHWFYGLYISYEHDPGSPPNQDVALAGLKPYRVLHIEDDEAASALAARFEARYELMHRSGGWDQPHPVLECFLPVDRVADVVPAVLDALPMTLGDGHRVLMVNTNGLPKALAVPSGDVAILAVLPFGVPRPLLDDALNGIQKAHAILLAAGGKRYLAGWLDKMDADAWRRHYGEYYDAWVEAKRSFDPNGILCSSLLPPSA